MLRLTFVLLWLSKDVEYQLRIEGITWSVNLPVFSCDSDNVLMFLPLLTILMPGQRKQGSVALLARRWSHWGGRKVSEWVKPSCPPWSYLDLGQRHIHVIKTRTTTVFLIAMYFTMRKESTKPRASHYLLAKYKLQIIIDLFPDKTSVILNEGVPFGQNIKQKLLQACEWENFKFSSRVKLSRRQTTQEVSPRVSLPGCRIPLLCTTFPRGQKHRY